MNKYKVKITHVFAEVLDIEAANEEEAKEKARLELEREDRPAAPQYETTLPLEHWPVISEDKYNEMVEKYKEELGKQEEDSNIITPNIITP
jgi:hypothetical protein